MIICVVLRSIKLDAVKSALDVFAQSTGNWFKLSVTSYGNDGQKLVITMVSPDYDKHRKDFNDLVAIIKTNKPRVNKLVDMRDEVTHSSDLTGLSSFMFKKLNLMTPKLLYIILRYSMVRQSQSIWIRHGQT